MISIHFLTIFLPAVYASTLYRMQENLCDLQLETCNNFCEGDVEVNYCDVNTLAFDCTCWSEKDQTTFKAQKGDIDWPVDTWVNDKKLTACVKACTQNDNACVQNCRVLFPGGSYKMKPPVKKNATEYLRESNDHISETNKRLASYGGLAYDDGAVSPGVTTVMLAAILLTLFIM